MNFEAVPPTKEPSPRRLPDALRAGLERRHLPALDGVRAIAAFLVVFYHFGYPFGGGSLGVLIFFVLSGFLITWLLLAEEEQRGEVSLRAFYVRRSLRIFPAFYAYWAVAMALALWRGRMLPAGQTIASFLYLNNYYQAIFGDPGTSLSHTWSLAIEEQFYLFWPVIFIALRTNRARLRFLACAVPLLWSYRWLMVGIGHVGQGWVYEAFDMRADHLLLGCLLALVLRQQAWRKLWAAACASSLLQLVTVALLVVELAVGRWAGIARYRDWCSFVIEPVLVAILIAQLIAFPGGPIGRLMEFGWMRYLGRISYSVYLYQQLAVAPATRLAHGNELLRFPLGMALVIGAASGSYYFVEKPFLKWKDRIHRKRVPGIVPGP